MTPRQKQELVNRMLNICIVCFFVGMLLGYIIGRI